MPFIPVEARQESPFQDFYKYKIFIKQYIFYMYLTSLAVAFLLTRSKLTRELRQTRCYGPLRYFSYQQLSQQMLSLPVINVTGDGIVRL